MSGALTFHRVITAEVGMALAGNVSIAFDEFGIWGAGAISSATVRSRAVQVNSSYHLATITGGVDPYEESYVLPASAAGRTTGTDTIAIPAPGEWEITFFCDILINPQPDAPLINGALTHLSTTPPWIRATIAGGDGADELEEFLVPWAGDD